MYELYLETFACKQIDAYCLELAGGPVEYAEELKRVAYKNFLSYASNFKRRFDRSEEGASNWLIDQCINGDRHKSLTIDTSFMWSRTDHGSDFWERVHVSLMYEPD